MPGVQDIPNDQFQTVTIPAEATAGNADSWPCWRAPFNATVQGVRWIPGAAVTGANTNNFALTVNNKTQTLGVTTTKTYASGTNSVANTAESLTLTANVAVNAGDVLAFDRTVNGTGLASPAGHLEITYRWR
jgi:hypothetical protein